jgi:hypothetical protein
MSLDKKENPNAVGKVAVPIIGSNVLPVVSSNVGLPQINPNGQPN